MQLCSMPLSSVAGVGHRCDSVLLFVTMLYRADGQEPSRNLTFTERDQRSIFAFWSSRVPHSCSEGFPKGEARGKSRVSVNAVSS